MKNLKKLLAVIVTVAMLASFAAMPVLAEEMTDAEICTELNVLQGSGNGVDAAYLADVTVRAQSAVMFLRLLGKEAEALATPYEGAPNFSDYNDAEWVGYKSIMAYLYANPDLGYGGYPDGTFQPYKVITAQEFYKVVLTALGYQQGVDFTWEGTLTFAASLGLSAVADVTSFTNNDFATAVVEALKLSKKGSTTTLTEDLVAAGVIDAAKAEEVGLYTAPVVDLAVASVSAANLAEIQVKFNKELDASTVVKENFTVDGDNAASVSLGADGMTVTVSVLAEGIGDNGGSYDVVVTTDVEDVDGMSLAANYSTTITVFDAEKPYVTSVELTGPKTFDITFSEPIETEGDVEINSGAYGITGVVLDGNVATVTIAAEQLAEKDYSVKISGFEDYAGFGMATVTKTLSYVKDLTAPVASISGIPQQTEVVIEFNKAVTLDDTNDYVDYFYHTFSAWEPTSVDKDDDNKTFTLNFAADDYPIPAGTTTLVVNAKGDEGKAIVDEWGNTMAANQTFTITVTADNDAPVVTGVEFVDEQTVKVTFNETINTDDANDEDNYTVLDSLGDEYAPDDADYDAAKDTVTLTWDDDLAGGLFTITISGIADISLAENVMATYAGEFTVTDATPITPGDTVVTAVAGDADEDEVIYVAYPEKMDSSVLSASNYLIDVDGAGAGAPAALSGDATLALFGSTGKVVKITIPDLDDFAVNTSILVIGRVKDAAGNEITEFSFNEVIGAELGATIASVTQTAPNKMTVVFNGKLKSVVAAAFRGYNTVTEQTYAIAYIDSWSVNDNQTTVAFTLTAAYVNAIKAIEADYEDDTSLVAEAGDVRFELVGENVVTEVGMKSDNDTDIDVDDGRAPVYTAVANDGDIILTFSEAVVVKDAKPESLCAFDLIVKNADGDTLTAGIDYDTSIDVDGNIVIDVGVDPEGYTVESKASITYIEDASGNKIAAFGEVEVPEID